MRELKTAAVPHPLRTFLITADTVVSGLSRCLILPRALQSFPAPTFLTNLPHTLPPLNDLPAIFACFKSVGLISLPAEEHLRALSRPALDPRSLGYQSLALPTCPGVRFTLWVASLLYELDWHYQ
jgi:hypothetical protein